MFHEILQRTVDQTIPARLSTPWDFLSPAPSVRILDSEPAALVASLLSEFSQDELLNAQILERISASEIRLTPAINAKTPFKVLSREKDGAPCDFEHEQGRLTAGDPAALRCLDDHVTREQIVKRKYVLATLSEMDQAVLTMLGLPATPACGLSTITADQARRRLAPPPKSIDPSQSSAESAPSSEARPKIILVATELFALRNQMPAGSLHAALQFERIERTMKLDTASAIGIWLPSPADFRRIEDGVALADPQLVRNAIKTSARRCESIAQYIASTTAPVADDVPRARKKLLEAISTLKTSTFDSRNLPALLEALHRAHENNIIEKANDEAMVATDPLDRSLWMSDAELMEMQFESSPLVQRTTAIAADRAVNLDTPLEDRLRFQQRLADGLIRIKKALAMNN
jgi:hypothetical protein